MSHYALLALIEDAPAVLKIATVICAVAALFTLETEEWLRKRQNKLFALTISGIGLIYAVFIVFAIYGKMSEGVLQRQIREIFVEAGPIIETNIRSVSTSTVLNEEDVRSFIDKAQNWEEKTSNWLKHNLGEAARERFVDLSSVAIVCWDPVCSQPFTKTKNRLVGLRKNLSVIIETPAYWSNP
jgi:hypothetical protein